MCLFFGGSPRRFEWGNRPGAGRPYRPADANLRYERNHFTNDDDEISAEEIEAASDETPTDVTAPERMTRRRNSSSDEPPEAAGHAVPKVKPEDEAPWRSNLPMKARMKQIVSLAGWPQRIRTLNRGGTSSCRCLKGWRRWSSVAPVLVDDGAQDEHESQQTNKVDVGRQSVSVTMAARTIRSRPSRRERPGQSK